MIQAQPAERTLKSLEWERLKRFLAAECSSAESKERALLLPLQNENDKVAELLQLGHEALKLLGEPIYIGQNGLPDIRADLERLSAGASLNCAEFLELKKIGDMSRKLAKTLVNLSNEYSCLKAKLLPSLLFPEPLQKEISRLIDEQGVLKDEASPLLSKLRRDLLKLNKDIRDELGRIINSPSLSKCLQEPLFTQRNGRYVLPVLAGMKQSIAGIVHDSSASGLTIYIEPLKVVELANASRLRELEIEHEIERLLRELSLMAKASLPAIRASYQALVEADFIAAKAELAGKYSGTMPELSKKPALKLKEAKHPLLILQSESSAGKVVANDIFMDEVQNALIITGPNTGGKTVYLKTAGLLALMLKAGLLLPVREGSSAYLFGSVFADIGDEQSLEQNLSTFSSHMSNIVLITRLACPDSLILLDEIGAGTDPREGVILARVILSFLQAKGALSICSTHFSELKTLAHSQAGFANASMDFDPETLRPLYKLIPGSAGNSMAIEVAERLGLDQDLTRQAREMLVNSKTENETLIEELESRLKKLISSEHELLLLKDELDAREAILHEKEKKLLESQTRLKQEAAASFESDYKAARILIAELTKELQQEPSLKRLGKAREEIEILKLQVEESNERNPESAAGAKKGKGGAKTPAGEFAPGQMVRLKQLGKTGRLEELEAQETAIVLVGRIKVSVPLAEIEAAETQAGLNSKKGSKSTQPKEKLEKSELYRDYEKTPYHRPADPVFVRSQSNTVDLRGLRVDAGLDLLNSFIDSAYLSHVSPIMIIHGHGSGAMKAAVRDFLSSCNYKNKSRPGEIYEGGDGVTIVNFA